MSTEPEFNEKFGFFEFDPDAHVGLGNVYLNEHGDMTHYELDNSEFGERQRPAHMSLTSVGDGTWHVTTKWVLIDEYGDRKIGAGTNADSVWYKTCIERNDDDTIITKVAVAHRLTEIASGLLNLKGGSIHRGYIVETRGLKMQDPFYAPRTQTALEQDSEVGTSEKDGATIDEGDSKSGRDTRFTEKNPKVVYCCNRGMERTPPETASASEGGKPFKLYF